MPDLLKVSVVCYEDPDEWILGKMARRLCRGLADVPGLESGLVRGPDASADVNHHVIYFDYKGRAAPVETLMVTHIDTQDKLDRLRRQVEQADMAICMSRDTLDKLASAGLPRRKLCYIAPAHDFVATPRPAAVGITSRVHSKGNKREYLVAQLAEHLDPTDFRFEIMGAGWDVVVDVLRRRGIEVSYIPDFDAARYGALLRRLDYYLYAGQDEGSMGFLDALAAGVPTIVTPQGFHLDVRDGITHAFNDIEELTRVFSEITECRRQRPRAVAGLTWAAYALKHATVFSFLRRTLRGQGIDPKERPLLEECGVWFESASVPVRAIPWQLPRQPGPGGAEHRPRVLVLTDLPRPSLTRLVRALRRRVPASSHVLFNTAGMPSDDRRPLDAPGWEVKLLEGKRSEDEIIALAGDFTVVYAFRTISPRLLRRLEKRSVPNYRLLKNSHIAVSRLLRHREMAARLFGPLFFGLMHHMRTETRVPMVIDITGGALRLPSSRQSLRALVAVDAVLTDDPEQASFLERHRCKVCLIRANGRWRSRIEDRLAILDRILPAALDRASAAVRPGLLVRAADAAGALKQSLSRRFGKGLLRAG